MTPEENPGFPKNLRLVAEGLQCQRGARTLFDGLSFSVTGGAALMVAGPNGSGKSSVLRILAGFLAAQAGRIRLDGLDDDADLARSCHYLGHRDGLRAALTPRENLRFFSIAQGAGDSLSDALEQVGLAHAADLPVGLLSAGQRRRIALARLLVSRRPLWLLDEPTSALDQASQQGVARILMRHCAAGGIAIVASHLPLGIECETLTLGAPS